MRRAHCRAFGGPDREVCARRARPCLRGGRASATVRGRPACRATAREPRAGGRRRPRRSHPPGRGHDSGRARDRHARARLPLFAVSCDRSKGQAHRAEAGFGTPAASARRSGRAPRAPRRGRVAVAGRPAGGARRPGRRASSRTRDRSAEKPPRAISHPRDGRCRPRLRRPASRPWPRCRCRSGTRASYPRCAGR